MTIAVASSSLSRAMRSTAFKKKGGGNILGVLQKSFSHINSGKSWQYLGRCRLLSHAVHMEIAPASHVLDAGNIQFGLQ